MGYYKYGTHDILDLKECPILDSRIESILPKIKRDIELTNWPTNIDPVKSPGIRHIGLRLARPPKCVDMRVVVAP